MAYPARCSIALLVLTAAAAQTPIRLFPIDDTARDRSFRSFAGKLRTAVEARDPIALRRLVDSEVVVGPDKDDKGWKKFEERWRPAARQDSPLWTALSDLLSLGFIREHPGLFLSPYLTWRFPRELNAASHLVVIRDKVPLRSEPEVRAPEVAWLSFDVVQRLGRVEQGEGLGEWVHVRSYDGRTGYANARDLRSPSMPRTQIALVKGRWLLVALE